jgi:hypothetical protein
MMRIQILALPLLAALALPMTASAGGLFNRGGCDSGSCNGGGCNGGHGGCFHGQLANHPPQYAQHQGHGFFQPPFQAAPWYLYWPYDAHFQLPAPIAAPFTPPQAYNTPWNPYFPAPAAPMMGYPGAPAYPGFAPAMPGMPGMPAPAPAAPAGPPVQTGPAVQAGPVQ